MNISDELRGHLQQNPNIQKVYFDADGKHYFNAYEIDGVLYTRCRQPFEEERENYLITKILTREEILEQELEELIGLRQQLLFDRIQ